MGLISMLSTRTRICPSFGVGCGTSSILITSANRIHECVLLSLVRSSTQLVRTDRKFRASCQEEGSARGRKDGKIQRGLHSRNGRHVAAEFSVLAAFYAGRSRCGRKAADRMPF